MLPVDYSIKYIIPLQGRVKKPIVWYANSVARFARRAHSADFLSSPSSKNFSLRCLVETALLIRTSRAPQEGRFAIVRNVGCGMRWTRQCRKTNDADPPSLKLRRDRYQGRRAAFSEGGRGRRSRVVLTPRRWCQVGENKFLPAMVARKPGHQGERGGNR
jgi:hypothetical protein